MATFTVTTLQDETDDGASVVAPGSTGLSLREALALADDEGANPGTDTVTFDATLSGGTLVLTQGALELSHADGVTVNGDIDGDLAADITISGNDTSRVFTITGAGSKAELRSLEITDGFTAEDRGGAIFSGADTTLIIVNSTIRDSTSTLAAGGLTIYGAATVVNSTFTGNASQYVTALEVSGANGVGTLFNVTVSGNVETGGAGMNGVGAIAGQLTIANSTLQGDQPVFANNNVSVYNSVIDGNVLGSLSSAYNNVFTTSPTVAIGGNNLINVAELGLATLAENGGPVQTLALQSGSVLINVGDVAYLPLDTADVDGDGDRAETLPIAADGGLRLLGGGLEAGAVEFTLSDAIDDAFSTDEETAIGTGLNLFDANPMTADSDPGDLLTITTVNGETADVGTQVTLASGALLLVNDDGTFSYDPNDAFEILSAVGGADPQEADSFTYTLNNDDTATVTIMINGLNDAPVATGEVLTATAEDTAITYAAADLLGNDSDVDVDTLSISGVTSGAGGTVVLNEDGTVTFAPSANDNGAADFTYTVTDGSATSDAVTASLTVTAVNDAPVATGEVLTATAEDTAITYAAADLLDNDSDVDADTLSISGVTSGAGGTVVLNEDGTVTFAPSANYNGAADFTYTVTDGSATSDPVTASLTVTAVNDAPVATGEALTATAEDTAITYSAADLLGNDSDVDVDTLSISGVTSGAGGTVVLNEDGTVTFAPSANYNGAADFTYTVTDGSATSDPVTASLTVTAVNDAPVATGEALTATAEETAITYSAADLLGNDSDVDVDTLSISGVTSGAGGTVVLNEDGTVTFAPSANYNGAADFTYTVTDGSATSDPVTASLTVTAVNDTPVGTVTIVGNATQGETLTASNTLGDADGLGAIAYHWVRDGLPIAGANGPSYVLLPDDVGAKISVVASYTDAQSTAESMASSATEAVAGLQELPNEAPSLTLRNVVTSLSEDSDTSNRIKVADIMVANDGVGEALLGLTGADAARFEIEGAELFLAAGAVLDFEDNPQFEVNVTVDDPALGAGIEDSVDLTLAIIDVDDTQPVVTAAADAIIGSTGADMINALGGDDTVFGGDGNDTLGGGSDHDFVLGQEGNDSLGGGLGMDILDGGSGNDTLGGGQDNDLISGGRGDDYLSAGAGNDVMGGGTGDDFLGGGYGHDSLFGGQGTDSILGGQGDDLLQGGTGDDWIAGGAGADTILGASGSDTIGGHFGLDEIRGGTGNDVISAGGNDDFVRGDTGHDTIFGGSGQDELHGGAGMDVIEGGAGNDSIHGNLGADLLQGGLGDDLLSGDGANDTLVGGAGADTLHGGDGNDLLTGGLGADVFVFADADGADTVSDFQDGVDLLAFEAGLRFSDLTIVDTEEGVFISGNGRSILLTSLNTELIDAGDFLF